MTMADDDAYKAFSDATVPMVSWDAPSRIYWPFDDGTCCVIVSVWFNGWNEMRVRPK